MDRLLTLAQVKDATGLGKSAIYAAMQRNDFPLPVKITAKASRWRESEIAAYIDSRPRHVGDRSRSVPA